MTDDFGWKQQTDILRVLGRLQEATIEKDGRGLTGRTSLTDEIACIFQAARIALPTGRSETAA